MRFTSICIDCSLLHCMLTITTGSINMFYISAGHHAKAQGASNGIHTEFMEAIKWQAKIIQYLDDFGLESRVVPNAKLKDKVDYINDGDPTYAIEVHMNGNMPYSGCETLYYPGSDRGYLLASCIQDNLHIACGNRDRGVAEGWHKRDPKNGPNFFLKNTKCPAVIVEPEFISNWDAIQEMRDRACYHIARSLQRAYEDGV